MCAGRGRAIGLRGDGWLAWFVAVEPNVSEFRFPDTVPSVSHVLGPRFVRVFLPGIGVQAIREANGLGSLTLRATLCGRIP